MKAVRRTREPTVFSVRSFSALRLPSGQECHFFFLTVYDKLKIWKVKKGKHPTLSSVYTITFDHEEQTCSLRREDEREEMIFHITQGSERVELWLHRFLRETDPHLPLLDSTGSHIYRVAVSTIGDTTEMYSITS